MTFKICIFGGGGNAKRENIQQVLGWMVAVNLG